MTSCIRSYLLEKCASNFPCNQTWKMNIPQTIVDIYIVFSKTGICFNDFVFIVYNFNIC